MTPAIDLVRRQGIDHEIHQYEHDAGAESYGLEAAEKLGQDVNRVFKTLVVKLDSGKLMVAILPVNQMLSLKSFSKAANARKASMAEGTEVQRSTGYVLGGVSPLGQKKPLKTIVDGSALSWPTIYISAGRRGLELELSADDLINLTDAKTANICQ